MVDLREYKEIVKEAVARERRCDYNWSWKIHSIGKSVIKIEWSYLSEYLSDKNAHFLVKVVEDEEVGNCVVGRAPNGHKVILFIGNSRWDDCKSYGEGIACAIHSIAQYAHATY